MNEPLVSVITPSLNHARFMRQTIESITMQSYPRIEHIVVDGGSIDETVSILNEYPTVTWISEPDHTILEAYRKAIGMAHGKYVIQCCVSDGFLERDWFKMCVDTLEREPAISLAWGLPRYMSEDGALGKISYSEFLSSPAPQRQAFLPYWLATGFILPEGNYCTRFEVLDRCFPQYEINHRFGVNPALPFNYNFNSLGYLPHFLPVVANFGRTHRDQRGQRLQAVERPLLERYYGDVRRYRGRVLAGRGCHIFRDGFHQPLQELTARELPIYRRAVHRWQTKRLVERVKARCTRELQRWR